VARHSYSARVVYAALLGNVLIATTKFAAAAWTSSSAMLSEAVHSLVDTSMNCTGRETLARYGRV
jgi:divalent metal cation (Fe/Co/Zn/Cd) transporter